MFFKNNSGITSLPMEKAKTELKNDASIHLIDVRSGDEYAVGHIPGSTNLPLDKISGITTLLPEKDSKIFVYCLSGARSLAACAQLVRLGYTKVFNLGGITRWNGNIERGVGA